MIIQSTQIGNLTGVTNALVNAAIAADPAESNQALSSGQTFNVKSSAYGATGDGVFLLESGAISATSTTLVVTGASFTAGDVGKRIIIRGAGASVTDSASQTNYRDLATSISAVTNATTVTLADAATTTVSDADVLYGTDDTAAIQDAIDAAHAVGGGTVFLPRGIYIIDGDAQDAADNNCILKIPGSLAQQVIEIRGETAAVNPAYALALPSTAQPSYSGTVLFRTKAHSGRLIGGDDEGVGAYEGMTRTMLVLNNLKITGYNGAAYKAVGALKIAWLQFDDITVSTWENVATRMLEPPAGSVGIEMPQKLNAAWLRGGNAWVQSFETGVQMREHSSINRLSVQFCKYGITSHLSHYQSSIAHYKAQWCATDIFCNEGPRTNLLIENFGWESYPNAVHGTRWFSRGYNIRDDNSYMNLRIVQYAGQLGGGNAELLSLNTVGCKNVRFEAYPEYTIDPRAFLPTRAVVSTGSIITLDIAGQIVPNGGSTGNPGCLYNGSSPPDGHTVTWPDIYTPAGKMKWVFVGRKSVSQGIAEFYVDGVLVHTEDLYAATSVPNYQIDILFDSVSAGAKDYQIKINGKNASATGYNLLWSQISLQKVN